MTKLEKKPGANEIAGLLRRQINDGILLDKERLPAERLLAETYAIARGTVRVALHLLVKDGILEIRPGSGAYVKYNNLEKNMDQKMHMRLLLECRKVHFQT